MTLSSAAGLAGGLGPLAVGLIAEAFGLPWALAGLVVVPLCWSLARSWPRVGGWPLFGIGSGVAGGIARPGLRWSLAVGFCS